MLRSHVKCKFGEFLIAILKFEPSIHLHCGFYTFAWFPIVANLPHSSIVNIMHLNGFSMAQQHIVCTIVIITTDISIEHFKVTATRSGIQSNVRKKHASLHGFVVGCDAIYSGCEMNSEKKMLLPKLFSPTNSVYRFLLR